MTTDPRIRLAFMVVELVGALAIRYIAATKLSGKFPIGSRVTTVNGRPVHKNPSRFRRTSPQRVEDVCSPRPSRRVSSI